MHTRTHIYIYINTHILDARWGYPPSHTHTHNATHNALASQPSATAARNRPPQPASAAVAKTLRNRFPTLQTPDRRPQGPRPQTPDPRPQAWAPTIAAIERDVDVCPGSSKYNTPSETSAFSALNTTTTLEFLTRVSKRETDMSILTWTLRTPERKAYL